MNEEKASVKSNGSKTVSKKSNPLWTAAYSLGGLLLIYLSVTGIVSPDPSIYANGAEATGGVFGHVVLLGIGILLVVWGIKEFMKK